MPTFRFAICPPRKCHRSSGVRAQSTATSSPFGRDLAELEALFADSFDNVKVAFLFYFLLSHRSEKGLS